jgi:hypothetical protein
VIVFSETLSHGDQISNYNPTKPGHTFLSWRLENNAYVETNPVTSSIRLDGLFEINRYLISFMDNESIITTQSALYETSIRFPEIPEKEGFTFIGFKDSTGMFIENGDFVYETIALYAIYEINTYTIEFLNESLEVVSSYSLKYNVSLNDFIIPEGPFKQNHTFIGWNQTLPDLMPASNIVMTPLYSQSINTVEVMVTFIIVYEDGSKEEVEISISDLNTLKELIETHNIIWPRIED